MTKPTKKQKTQNPSTAKTTTSTSLPLRPREPTEDPKLEDTSIEICTVERGNNLRPVSCRAYGCARPPIGAITIGGGPDRLHLHTDGIVICAAHAYVLMDELSNRFYEGRDTMQKCSVCRRWSTASTMTMVGVDPVCSLCDAEAD